MLHRDVSVNNIMYEMRGGKYYFILIDFDMAVVCPDAEGESSYVASSKHRTGTLAFMSRELVQDAMRADRPGYIPIPHRLHHDFESLFWVVLWCLYIVVTIGLENYQKRALRDRVRSWDSGKLRSVAAAKKDDMTVDLEYDVDISPSAESLSRWFSEWIEILDKLIRTKRVRRSRIAKGLPVDPDFDEESVGGILSRDSLKAALTPCMPFHQDTEGMNLDAAPGVLPPEAEKRFVDEDVDDEDEDGEGEGEGDDQDEDAKGHVPEEALIVADDFALGAPPKPRRAGRGRTGRAATPVSASRAVSKARGRSKAAPRSKSKAASRSGSKAAPRSKSKAAPRGEVKATTATARAVTATKPRSKAKASSGAKAPATKVSSRTVEPARAKAKAAASKPSLPKSSSAKPATPAKASSHTDGASGSSRKPRKYPTTSDSDAPDNEMRSRLRSYTPRTPGA